MDEQPRGTEMPRGGLRKFMNDPKSSVMSYLAENMAAQHLQQQIQQQNHGSSGPPPTSSSYGQQYSNQGSNGLSSQFQSHSNASQTSLAQSQTAQNEAVFQSSSPQNSNLLLVQNAQIPPIMPYIASNIASNGGRPSEVHPGAQSGILQSQQQNSQMQQFSQAQGSETLITNLGKMPPTSGMKHNTSPQSAPRLYHRMNLDFEVAKSTFFMARAQHNSQEMTSAAYDLESLSRRIWILRFEHAWEFEGFQESGHQAVIASWQAQYELWADTVLDIQEGDSAASMFSVHRTSSIEESSVSVAPSMNTIEPTNGAGATNPYSQVQQSAFSNMSTNPQGQALGQDQQVLDHRNISIGQNVPMNLNAQSPPPQPQHMPPTSMPEGYTSAGMPSSAGNPGQQPMPFQQQSTSPPSQQSSISQNGRMSSQNEPPSIGPGPQNSQNTTPNSRPNIQQGPPQQTPPDQMPPQQLDQQMQGRQASMQQSPYMNHRPPSGPPHKITAPPMQMPQMPQGQNQSPRPYSNLPQSLQTGGR